MTSAIPISEILSGSKMAVAKSLNLLEDSRPGTFAGVKALIEDLSRHAREDRHLIGVTGPPGVGKSTLISRIIHELRSCGKTVGVISVDPSSKRSGGALLGDRARIAYDPGDPGVFIRSMAAGSHLGGLAWRTRHCLAVFEAAFDVVIIETVGVGQSETEVEEVVDTVVFVVQPGSGDALQFMKAGIMEIPHILVVNKSDQVLLAQKAMCDLQAVGDLGRSDQSGWTPRVIMTSALSGQGVDELVAAAADHHRMLSAGNLARKREDSRRLWIYLMFKERFGSFGIDALGGEKKVLEAISRFGGDNPFTGLEALETALMDIVKRHLDDPGEAKSSAGRSW